MFARKHFIKLYVAGLLLLLSCSKSGTDTAAPTGTSLGYSPLPTDGIQFPITIGSNWEYQRIDSFTINYNVPGNTNFGFYTSADTSKELITLTGDTLISAIDPVKRLFVLQITNLTKSSLDTAYLLYTNNRYAMYTRLRQENDDYFYSPNPPVKPNIQVINSYWMKQVKFSLPITNFFMDSALIKQIYVDTAFTTKDTTVSVLSNTFKNCVYWAYYDGVQSFSPSGVGGYQLKYYSFLKPSIGIVFEYFTPHIMQSPINFQFHGKVWTVRRLVNYKIL